jgi:hypothetical protein
MSLVELRAKTMHSGITSKSYFSCVSRSDPLANCSLSEVLVMFLWPTHLQPMC